MIQSIQPENILFLDVETVPQHPNDGELSEQERYLWQKKAQRIAKGEEDPNSNEVYQRAGIYAEFGKIVAISVGFMYLSTDGWSIRLKSFMGDDEKALLKDFGDLVQEHYSKAQHFLCGHNIKEFDIPYIARRMLINGLKLPDPINVAGKKPWEVKHLDTLELWKFGDYKAYTSLELLAHVFGIPTPKDDIDGSQVGRVYWQEGDLQRIAQYCEKDVVTVIQLWLKFNNQDLIDERNISFTNWQ